MSGRKAQQFGNGFLVGVIFRRAFFQYQTELFPEGLVFFRVVLSQFFQGLQGAFGQRVTQITGHGAVLEDFTRHIERQIVGINQATDKAQVVRHELLSVIHDEDTLHIEFQAVFMIAVPHVPRCLGRHIQQAGVLLLAFHAVVAPDQRIGEVMGDMLVELFVLVIADFGLATGPQRLGFVDFLEADDGFAVFFFMFFNLNRQGDVIGVFADDRTHAPVIKEFILAFTQVQSNFGAAIGFIDVCDGVFAFARRFPEHALFSAGACSTGAYGHFIRHDKR